MCKRFFAWILILCLLSVFAFAEEEPQAVLRGKTLIVRIPYEWLKARCDDGTLEGWAAFGADTDEVPLEQLDVIWRLARGHLGSRALDFVADCMDGEAAPVDGYWALGYTGGAKDVIMTQQAIDDAWYTISRLDGNGLPETLHCDGSRYRLDMRDGMLRMEGEIYDCTQMDIEIVKQNGLAPVFSKDGIEVFEVFDRYLAVVTQKIADKNTLWNACAIINGEKMRIEAANSCAGYRDGDGNGVFCFFITPSEFESLKIGGGITMVYDPF